MLQNAYLLAKIGADTAENEQHFAEILPSGRGAGGGGGGAADGRGGVPAPGRAARAGGAPRPGPRPRGAIKEANTTMN